MSSEESDYLFLTDLHGLLICLLVYLAFCTEKISSTVLNGTSDSICPLLVLCLREENFQHFTIKYNINAISCHFFSVGTMS